MARGGAPARPTEGQKVLRKKMGAVETISELNETSKWRARPFTFTVEMGFVRVTGEHCWPAAAPTLGFPKPGFGFAPGCGLCGGRCPYLYARATFCTPLYPNHWQEIRYLCGCIAGNQPVRTPKWQRTVTSLLTKVASA